MAKSHLDKPLTPLAGELFAAGHLCLRSCVACVAPS